MVGTPARRRCVFVLTFASYAALHVCRMSYSNAKLNMAQDWGVRPNRLGAMDAAFMLAYAVGMFGSGVVGDVSSPKAVLVLGMMLSAVVLGLMGLAGALGIASTAVLIVCMALNGLFQSAAWPNCVAIVGNWTQASSRGLLMGIWGTNANVGNLLGSLLTALMVGMGLGIPALLGVPAALLVIIALISIFFLEEYPTEHITRIDDEQNDEDLDLLVADDVPPKHSCSSKVALLLRRFVQAVRLPGVIGYSLSYAAVKSVNYSLFFWLPTMLHANGFSTERADLFSAFYDAGGVLGGLVSGYIADVAHMQTVVVVGSLILSFVSLVVLLVFQSHSVYSLATLLVVTGALVNGPAILITTSVSADLGAASRSALLGDEHHHLLMASVSGIIDGSGSIGAALTQLFQSMY